MEVALVGKNSVRIKGKKINLFIDPEVGIKNAQSEDEAKLPREVAIELIGEIDSKIKDFFSLVIFGPGEFESAGVKTKVIRVDNSLVCNSVIDRVNILIGKLSGLEKVQAKFDDQNMAIVYVDKVENASFVTSLASNVIILYGDKAGELASTFGEGSFNKSSKYSVVFDKLPTDVEKIVLE